MKRKSGILLHISSLPSGYGIGSFGREAYGFVDFLAESGFGVWQVLPFCMPDGYNSPYKSRAFYSVNPYFIDIDTLVEKGYLTAAEAETAKEREPYIAEYERLSEERLELLLKAAERMRGNKAELRLMEAFFEASPKICDAATFLALSEANSGEPWQKWKCEKADPVRLFLWKFIQYEFHSQWTKLKAYANSKGISIIGDLPMYVDLDSADVWGAPDMFQLDSDGYPTSVAGVPPDAFSEEGQLWGNPLYNYDKMREDGYALWQSRVEYMLTLFDGVRIDHFRAFESYWAVPVSAKSAKEGKWVKGPGEELVDVIKRAALGKLIIAEDLGVITDEVRALLDYSDFPGMRVFQFGFSEDYDNPHMPHNYGEGCVAYTGTHDNNTTLGYLYELGEWERSRVLEYVSADPCNLNSATERVVRAVLQSHAPLCVIPLQDILGYGRDTRMNIPGTPKRNWAYRVASWQLDTLDRKRLYALNSLYGRV